ncbi:MAG: CHAT domain-containing protein, partial [Planctomycetota bacterium]
MAISSRSKSRDRRRGTTAEWAVLFYLAGDLKTDPEHKNKEKSLAPSLQSDLMEILKAGASPEVRVAVQHDHPETGAARYLLPNRPLRKPVPTMRLGSPETGYSINSGSAEVLADFLRWGLAECPAKRVALVLGGFSALDPGGTPGEAVERVFTICRDDSAGTYMDAIDLGTVIRRVLREYDRELLDLLAIDSCQTQFLELAYELEGRVEVLLAPQSWVPDAGWDYNQVLKTWKQAARRQPGQLDAVSLARELVPEICQAYGAGKKTDRQASLVTSVPFVVSALDLRRLDDVARAFDTLCIAMLQVLGEGLIWEARELVRSLVTIDDTEALDCGSLFEILAATLEAMADESTQGWLGVTLERGAGASDCFRKFAAESLEQCLADKTDLRAASLETLADKSIQESLGVTLDDESDAALDGSVAAEVPDDWILRRQDLTRLRKWVRTLRSERPKEAGTQMLKQIGKGIRDRISKHEDWMGQRSRAKIVDAWLDGAVRTAVRLLPEARRIEYERQRGASASALRLARQARLCSSILFGTAATQGTDGDVEEDPGMVVAAESTAGEPKGWPRWSGVSLYRPPELDALMNSSYQGFRFHQRIHWAALLGAANLIEGHPRAMWRLISSLLATGAAGTRRDLLQRLTGTDSVIWGLRDQFEAMVPAPTLTLSLEQRPPQPSPAKKKQGALIAAETQPPAPRENYLLRLESANHGAVINEQVSRVQPRVMDRALRELDKLLAAPTTTAESLKRLRAIGGQLGDDIFQTLGEILEQARMKALEGSAHLAPHLQLQIPRELMGYPWELMHHNGKWLSEQFAIGRQVFMETGMARRVSRRGRGRVRPLIVGDPKLDLRVQKSGWRQLPGARAEAEQVAGLFEQLRHELGEMIDFDRKRDTRIHTRLTNQDLRDLLRHGNYDIIHFAGHGEFHADDPETSAWILSDGELWALELRNTLANHPAPPWLVYANACKTGMESRAATHKYQRNVFGL